MEAFDFSSRGEDLESCGDYLGDLLDEPGGLSDCDSGTWTGVPVVTDVLVSSSSSVVAEMCEDVSSDSDREFAEPQSFSFSRKRSIVCVENQGEMSY